jgi:hypothetical protein
MLKLNPVIPRLFGNDDEKKLVGLKTKQNAFERITGKFASGLNDFKSLGDNYLQKTTDGLQMFGVNININKPIEVSKPVTQKERVINKLVATMGAQFSTPEFKLIREGDPCDSMYFLQHGDCVVSVRDHNLKQASAIRLLTEGSLFGEIGLIYEGARRSAEIVCRNYVTLASISKNAFNVQIAPEMPDLV